MAGQVMEPPSTSPKSEGEDGESKFSLLGQQFSRYGSAAQNQVQSSQTASISFSLVPPLPHNQVALNSQKLANSSHGGSGGGNGGSFSDVRNQHMPPLQGYNLAYGAHHTNESNIGESSGSSGNPSQACNTQVLLNTLSVLQRKIHQLQSLVQLMAQEDRQSGQSSTMIAQQQVVTTSVASIISQLMVAAAGMLPLSQQTGLNLSSMTTAGDLQLGHLFGASLGLGLNAFQQNGAGNSATGPVNGPVGANNIFSLDGGSREANMGGLATSQSIQPQNPLGTSNSTHEIGTSINAGSSDGKVLGGVTDANDCDNGNGIANQAGDSLFTSQRSGGPGSGDDNDFGGNGRDEDDDGEGESLPPGSYQLVEMDAVEILAEHTHFCDICGKGFKRDANLRMHMRGHGDEYKTPAALARPDKAQDSAPAQPRRYSCPFVGCKRNKKHKKFQPLKTMLCVKNHYRRSHCPKMYTCNRCKSKKFSVVADLKTHEKHCGRDKWQCSCGTTFSRKDKLFGHIALFQGHTPVFSPNEMEGGALQDQVGNNGGASNIGNSVSGFANGCGNVPGILAGSEHVGSIHSNSNAPSIGPGANGTALESSNGASHSQIRLKNIGFSEESNPLSMAVDSSNQISGFPQSAPTLMPEPFMFQSLLSNNFLQQGRGN